MLENGEFGYVLREIRQDRKWSQEELAKCLGTSKQVISRYETGQRVPKITTVADYAKRLGVTLEYLMGVEGKSAYEASLLLRQGKIRELEKLYNLPESSIYEIKEMKPNTPENVRLLYELNSRPLLRELFEILSKLDDEHLQAFATIVDAPTKQMPRK